MHLYLFYLFIYCILKVFAIFIKTFVDVSTFTYRCFYFVNLLAFVCGFFLRLPCHAPIHKCIFSTKGTEVANQMSPSSSANHMSVAPPLHIKQSGDTPIYIR